MPPYRDLAADYLNRLATSGHELAPRDADENRLMSHRIAATIADRLPAGVRVALATSDTGPLLLAVAPDKPVLVQIHPAPFAPNTSQARKTILRFEPIDRSRSRLELTVRSWRGDADIETVLTEWEFTHGAVTFELETVRPVSADEQATEEFAVTLANAMGLAVDVSAVGQE